MLSHDADDRAGQTGVDPRTVPFETCFNFRDLGGLPAAGGRRTRQATLYRSDSLHRLHDADLARLDALGLRTVVDLRTVNEVEHTGQCVVGESCALLHVPMVDDIDEPDRRSSAFAASTAGEIYVYMVTRCASAIARAIGALARPEARPAVFHCASGKDRTGVLAALLLDLVGVADDDIAADYMLTAGSRPRRDAWLRQHDPATAEFFANLPPHVTALRVEAILGVLDHIRREHGSTRGYLLAAGVDPEALGTLEDALLD
jgi:hypothetical protein